MFIPNNNTSTSGLTNTNLMNGSNHLKIADPKKSKNTEVLHELNNIDNRKESSFQLNNFFEQIYKSTPEAILILDENNIVLDSNPSFQKP
jgi:PAS domain-containing protein